ncbi:hypothetical protein DERF_014818 [Dermatophagoides farinae]|uniref:Uncharacterized protein n=1 Tax=Dermatophagoides farinae TaxID=6954 RepID=A0A922HJR0_DERFA|nr:hypothetical protein DERF_014818 [Dermatophagoides farinae]
MIKTVAEASPIIQWSKIVQTKFEFLKIEFISVVGSVVECSPANNIPPEIYIIGTHNPNTESTKRRKYELLANELKSMYGCKVTTVPIVLTWDGLVTRHFRKYAESLGLSEKIQAYIQGQVLKRTMESVRIDLSSSQECTG